MTLGFVDPRDDSESNHNFGFVSNVSLNNEQDFLVLMRNTVQIFLAHNLQ